MQQRRLEHYFSPSYAPFISVGRSFIDFPYPVRKLVYRYAGLDDIFVDLNYTNLKVYSKGTYPETQDCRKLEADDWYDLRKLDTTEMYEVWELNDGLADADQYGMSPWGRPYGSHQSMLLVSKQIHKEVEAITYAEAVFRVCMGQPLGLMRLWRMSDNAFFNLSSLTIRLDVPKTAIHSDAWADLAAPTTYIDLSTKAGKAVFRTWDLTLKRLQRSIRPGHLRLRVIFCAKTMRDARALAEPIVMLPPLKDCGIRAEIYVHKRWSKSNPNNGLYQNPWPTNVDLEVAEIVQQITRKVTFTPERDPAPFRYLDLPQELRLTILEYTGLVSPNAVQWRPRRSIVKSQHCKFCKNDYITTDESNTVCSCFSCPSPNLDDLDWYQCCETCTPDDHSGICYCSGRGAIWSSSCKCPYHHTLFFVSRQVRQDAIKVYYTYNQILVTPYNSPVIREMDSTSASYSWPVVGIHCMPKIELSLYVSSITRNALQQIRWLEWILPSSQQTYLLPETPAWLDYVNTLISMQNVMDLSALTFTINMSSSGMYKYGYPVSMCMPFNDDALKWYETIILPVKRLGDAGLKDFFVHLRWFSEGSPARIHHEQTLERAVMGSNYNSQHRAKPPERMFQFFKKLKEETERLRDSGSLR